MIRNHLTNLAVLVATLILCALILEGASRIFFDAPPSVSIENLPTTDDQIRSWKRFEIEDGKIVSEGLRIGDFICTRPRV